MWSLSKSVSSKKRGFVLLSCLAIVCIVALCFFVWGIFSDSKSVRYMRNLYSFVGELSETVKNTPSDPRPWQEQIKVDGDPKKVLITYSELYADDAEIVDRETIVLKASHGTVLPGTKVTFEASPSPETKKMSYQILLYCDAFDKTTPLVRGRDGNYRGSLKFDATDAGEFGFFITTLPEIGGKGKASTVYSSNKLMVYVTPDAETLSNIYFQGNTPFFVNEGESEPLVLIAEGKNGMKYKISNPALGTTYGVDDENLAVVDAGGVLRAKSAGWTTLRASYHGLRTEVKLGVLRDPTLDVPKNSSEPPRPDRPCVIRPVEGAVVRVGTKIVFEASSFDTSKGHSFIRSSWRVYRGKGPNVADLTEGDSNVAEWTPQRPGTFEWIVRYYYNGPGSGETEYTLPARFTVVE